MNDFIQRYKSLLKKAQDTFQFENADNASKDSAQQAIQNPDSLYKQLLYTLQRDIGDTSVADPAKITADSANSQIYVKDLSTMKNFFDYIIRNGIKYDGKQFLWSKQDAIKIGRQHLQYPTSENMADVDPELAKKEDQEALQAFWQNEGKNAKEGWNVYDINPNGKNQDGDTTYNQNTEAYFADRELVVKYLEYLRDTANSSGDTVFNTMVNSLIGATNTELTRVRMNPIDINKKTSNFDKNQILDAFNTINDPAPNADLVKAEYNPQTFDAAKYKTVIYGKDVDSLDGINQLATRSGLVDENGKSPQDADYNDCWVINRLWRRASVNLANAKEEQKPFLQEYVNSLESIANQQSCDIKAGKSTKTPTNTGKPEKGTTDAGKPAQSGASGNQSDAQETIELASLLARAKQQASADQIPIVLLMLFFEKLKTSKIAQDQKSQIDNCLSKMNSLLDNFGPAAKKSVQDTGLILFSPVYIKSYYNMMKNEGTFEQNAAGVYSDLRDTLTQTHSIFNELYDDFKDATDASGRSIMYNAAYFYDAYPSWMSSLVYFEPSFMKSNFK